MLTKRAAYEKWLGIAEHQQPASLYRLLGIDDFESNPDIIVNAGDSRMESLRQFQIGENATLANEIVNEIALAELTLLDIAKKTAYDRTLPRQQAKNNPEAAGARAEPVPAEGKMPRPRAPSGPLPVAKQLAPRPATKQSAPRPADQPFAGPATGVDIDSLVSQSSPAGSIRRHRKKKNNLAVWGFAGIAAAIVAVGILCLSMSGTEDPPGASETHFPVVAASAPHDRTPSASATAATPAKPGGSRLPPADTTVSSPPPPRPVKEAPPDRTNPIAADSDASLEQDAMERRQKLLTGQAAAPHSASVEPALRPVPDAAAQAETNRLVKEVYGQEWAAAKTDEARQEFARKLLGKARETEKDPTARFVLLRLSKDIAVRAADAATAFEAIDEMNKSYRIDVVESKVEVLDTLASKAQTAEQDNSAAKKSLAVAEEAVARDNFAAAKQLAELAFGEARKGRDPALIKQASQRVAEIEQLSQSYEAVKKATAALAGSPNDPDGNLTVGKYKSFVKGDWAAGLPMLARGSDEALKALAARDLAGAASSDEQVKLGDDWWNLAETEDGRAKKQVQGHAAIWYRKALPTLSGLVEDKVQKRLGEFAVPVDSADGKDQPAPSKGGSNLAEQIVGAYEVIATQKRANQQKKFVWDFSSDGTLSEKNNRVGKWDADDQRVRIQFFDKASGQATLHSRKKGTLLGGQTYPNGVIWSCVLTRLTVAAKGEHRSGGHSQPITLWSNGHINSPDGDATWGMNGTRLILRWSPSAIDYCILSADRKTYASTFIQGRTAVSGSLAWTD